MMQRSPKPDLSTDQPAPPPTKGLTRLDRERAESMADEGGAAAAVVEFPEPGSSAAVRPARAAGSGDSKRKKPRGRKNGRR